MTLFLSVLLLGTGLFYAGLLGFLVWGFRRIRSKHRSCSTASEDLPFVSVVIAARNEEKEIAACLRSVLKNDYPDECFEVIVVDDDSEDRTAAVVRRLQRRYNPALVDAGGVAEHAPERLRLVQLYGGNTGHKHAALQRGIAAARGDLILTTDADCRARPGWLRAMANAFTPDTGFVAGPVRYRPGERLFGRLQALEFLGLQAFGAGGIGTGQPSICNSANVAYRREVYEAYAASHTVGAAADELLLQHLADDPHWDVQFCADPAAIVETDPAPDLQAFLAQRRRWASMGPRYPRKALVATVAVLYLFYVLLLATPGLVWFSPVLILPLLIAFGLKFTAEAALLWPAARFFEQRRLLRYFPLAELLHLPYAVYVGAAGALGEVEWKGRTLC